MATFFPLGYKIETKAYKEIESRNENGGLEH